MALAVPKALLGGLAHLGWFIDTIRLRNAGLIQDYDYITVGFVRKKTVPRTIGAFPAVSRRNGNYSSWLSTGT